MKTTISSPLLRGMRLQQPRGRRSGPLKICASGFNFDLTSIMGKPAPVKNPYQPPRRIVVAIDNSFESTRAFEWTLSHLWREGDEVHLVHVVPELAPGDVGAVTSGWTLREEMALEEDIVEQAKSYIKEEYIGKHKDKNVVCEIDILKEGKDHRGIGDHILEKARRLQAVTIVMAQHKKPRLEEFVYGSVSKYVVERSLVPVVVYH